ncbi:hypothetical protein V2J09_017435 [Rumex salicifolius]
MENYNVFIKQDDDEEQIVLHPGFRFHPTDEELISYYLAPKVFDSRFKARAIGEADLNKVEPWELPRIAKIGEEEWYFFCVRDKKYPTGLRTNRATESGYWKATGKDKEIYRESCLVGMKKTLVFYTGRAPKGIKSNWVMHEYRLEGKFSKQNLPKTAKNEWVISRVFNKTPSGKKTHISAFTNQNSHHEEDEEEEELMQEPSLPPLTETSPYNSAGETKSNVGSYYGGQFVDYNQTPSSSFQYYPEMNQFSDSYFAQDQSILKLLIDGNGDENDLSSCFAGGSTVDPSRKLSANGPIDIDCLMNY